MSAINVFPVVSAIESILKSCMTSNVTPMRRYPAIEKEETKRNPVY
jgi:hypothetical protein